MPAIRELRGQSSQLNVLRGSLPVPFRPYPRPQDPRDPAPSLSHAYTLRCRSNRALSAPPPLPGNLQRIIGLAVSNCEAMPAV